MRPLKVVTCRRHNPTLGFPQHFLVIINPAQEPVQVRFKCSRRISLLTLGQSGNQFAVRLKLCIRGEPVVVIL